MTIIKTRVLYKTPFFYVQYFHEFMHYDSGFIDYFKKWDFVEDDSFFNKKPKPFKTDKEAENYAKSLINKCEGYDVIMEIP